MRIVLSFVVALAFMVRVGAADPLTQNGDWAARNFKFHTGEILPQLRLHYVVIGNPRGLPVIVLHGTGGSSASMLTTAFAGQLFGSGQPLDAAKYFVIIPDALGHGQSAKPSDGLKTKFPHYDYTDMVDAQYRLLTEGLHVRHVRLIIGQSMGGMETWIWGERYPGFMDALVPMASQPAPMSSRNWMLRRMMIETVRNDPGYHDGDYAREPEGLKYAAAFFGIATSGGTLNYQKMAPTRALADQLVDQRLAAPPPADANDFLWQWASSADFDPSPNLDRIQASVLAINSADDERNPPETGVTEQGMKRLKRGTLYLIPASDQTSGHATTANARFYTAQLRDFLQTIPQR